jgi:hypothetical protein
VENEKTIRFITSDYEELFQIPDGGAIVVTSGFDGVPRVHTCKYLDEVHFEISGECYHICQFAEIMERNGNKCEPQAQIKSVVLSAPEKTFDLSKMKKRIAGRIVGEFRGGDGRYFVSRSGFEEKPEARREAEQILFALRKKYFPDRAALLDYCEARPEARERYEDSTDFKPYRFKIRGQQYDYYIFCNPKNALYDNDTHFYIDCCEKARQRARTGKVKRSPNHER